MTEQITTLIDAEIAKLTFARSLILGEALPNPAVIANSIWTTGGVMTATGSAYPADWRVAAKKSKPVKSAKSTAPKSKPTTKLMAAPKSPKRRHFSPEAKERMRKAQVARWKRFYAAKGAA